MASKRNDTQADDEYDALNDETFGGDDDEWEWSESAELAPSPNQLSLERNSLPTGDSDVRSSHPMHSSDLMTSMMSMPNVSGIRRLSDIEQSFSSIGLQDDSGPPEDPAIMKYTKSSDQPLTSSLLHDNSASSDPFSSFSLNRNRLSSSVWAPPDHSLFETSSSVPLSLSSGSPVPPAPPSDPWKTPVTSASAHRPLNNNNSINDNKETLIGRMIRSASKTPTSRLGIGNANSVPQPLRLEDLEASFLTDTETTSSPREQKQQPVLLSEIVSTGVSGRGPVVPPHPFPAARDIEHEMLIGRLRSAEQKTGPPGHMMPIPMQAPLPIGVPFPMPHLMPGGRVGIMPHPPHVAHNLALMQQHLQYRQPLVPPMHPQFATQHQLINHMQMQQHRFPYHSRVTAVNNSMRPERVPLEARRPVDDYAGFMSQKEREWLIKIQKLQLESSVSDPYTEDYYAMCYNSKKMMESKKRQSQTAPTLMVVEPLVSRGLASVSQKTESKNGSTGSSTSLQTAGSQYEPLQFENSLGKIQVSNIQCPRKLLDLLSKPEKTAAGTGGSGQVDESEAAKPLARKELAKFRELLLQIESLYDILMGIDKEDKRMAALPQDRRQAHIQRRADLCRQLFAGITKPSADSNNDAKVRLNIEIASIRKGCALIFRALELLSDRRHKEVIINDLLDEENYHLVVNQKDKELYSLNFLEILFQAMKSVNPSLKDAELTRVAT